LDIGIDKWLPKGLSKLGKVEEIQGKSQSFFILSKFKQKSTFQSILYLLKLSLPFPCISLKIASWLPFWLPFFKEMSYYKYLRTLGS